MAEPAESSKLDTTSRFPITVQPILSSAQFYIGCGTVTVDPRARKWLGIRYRGWGDVHLPRGRKDWGERFETTAERETFEESGFRSRLLPSYMTTRSTRPGLAASDPAHRYHAAVQAARFVEGGDVLVDGAKLTEPFALLPHYQASGALALVFFFLAVGDSSVARVAGEESGQEPEEQYDAIWFDYGSIPLNMRAGYGPIVEQGVKLAEAVAEKDGVEVMLRDVEANWEPVQT